VWKGERRYKCEILKDTKQPHSLFERGEGDWYMSYVVPVVNLCVGSVLNLTWGADLVSQINVLLTSANTIIIVHSNTIDSTVFTKSTYSLVWLSVQNGSQISMVPLWKYTCMLQGSFRAIIALGAVHSLLLM